MTSTGQQLNALYRWFNEEGQLLYVGISRQIGRRVKEHSKTAAWFTQAAYMTLEWATDQLELEAMEKKAIQQEGPLHNTTYNHSPQVHAGLTPMHFREQSLLMQLGLVQQELATVRQQLENARLLVKANQWQVERAMLLFDLAKVQKNFVVCNHKELSNV